MTALERKTADWVGRPVRFINGIEVNNGQEWVVIAVDDTDYRPSAWVKTQPEGSEYPRYRSIDLCELEDNETGEIGPAWGDHGLAVLKEE